MNEALREGRSIIDFLDTIRAAAYDAPFFSGRGSLRMRLTGMGLRLVSPYRPEITIMSWPGTYISIGLSAYLDDTPKNKRLLEFFIDITPKPNGGFTVASYVFMDVLAPSENQICVQKFPSRFVDNLTDLGDALAESAKELAAWSEDVVAKARHIAANEKAFLSDYEEGEGSGEDGTN